MNTVYGKVITRQEVSNYASVLMDNILEPDDVALLHKKWKSDKWGSPIEFRGGQLAISVDMVIEVGMEAIVTTYGKTAAARIWAKALQFKD